MIIWDQSKPISLYLKIKKLKNSKFVNCTFIIHKKGNKGKKVIHWGGLGGMGEPS